MIARLVITGCLAGMLAGFSVLGASPAVADDDAGPAGVSVTIPTSAGSSDPDDPPGSGSICSITETGEPVPLPEPVDVDAVATLDRPGYVAGDAVTAAAGGFQPGQQVQFVLYSEPVVVATGVADDSGAVSAGFTVPADTPPGPHTLQLTGWNCGAVATASLVVSSIAGGADASAGAWWLLAAGLALLASMATLLVGLRGGWFRQARLGGA